MGIIAIAFFFGALAASLVWSLICSGLTAWLKKRQLPINFLTLPSLNLGLSLFPFHGATLSWQSPTSSDNGIGALLDMSIWFPVVSIFLIYWLIVLWIERYQSWSTTLAVTILVPGLCYAYYRYPNFSWAVILIAVMVALQVKLFCQSKLLLTK